MHFFQLVAAWLFPCAVCAAAVTTAAGGAGAAEHGRSSSSSSLPAFRAGGAGADPGSSSPSDASTASSSPPPSVLGVRSPDRQLVATEAAKGDVVRRCVRRLARHLQRADGGDREHAPRRRRKTKSGRATKPPLAATRARGDAVDGTAREREEAVAGAIAYCKQQTSQCKCRDSTSPSRRRDASSDDGLLGRQQNSAAGSGNSSVTQRGGGSSGAVQAAGRTLRRGPAAEEPGKCGGGGSSSFSELELDALRITSCFTAKYMRCNIE